MAADRRSQLAEADKAVRKGRHGRAVEIYRELLQSAPRDLNLQQRLADSLARGGKSGEACDLFASLADLYWEAGHRTRAVATLRRALRIRARSPRLLFRLAGWMLEQGHPVDAREPFFAAAKLELDEDMAREALDPCRSIARHFASDPEVHEAIVAVATRAGEPQSLALAQASRALALARAGHAEEAGEALTGALEADTDDFAALRRVPQLVEVVESVGSEGLLGRAEKNPRVSLAMAVLVAAWHGRHARDAEGAALLVSAAGRTGEAPGPLLVHVAEQLLQLGQGERSRETLERIGDLDQLSEVALRRATRVAHGLAAALPQDARAAALVSRLGAESAPAGQGPAEVVDDAAGSDTNEPIALDSELETRAGAEAAPAGAPGRRHSVELTQVLVEAQTLLSHGLAASAADVLERLDDSARSAPQVQDLLHQIARRRGEIDRKKPRKQAVKPAPAVVPPGEDRGDDVLVLLEDEETGFLREDAVHASKRPEAVLSSVSELESTLQEVLTTEDVQDDETRYQMAVGLLQMGLEDQAITMLETCLENPERRAVAALELVRLHTQRGTFGSAIEIGERALGAPDLTLALRGDLLAEVAAVAFHEGREDLARESLEELGSIQPDHPALEGLRARTMASGN